MNFSPELKKEVEDFLKDFRDGSKPYLVIEEREKNDDFFIRSNISREEIEEILLKQLSYRHYRKGPEPEQNLNHPQGVIYFFEYPWESYRIYIKLKVFYHVNTKLGICLSFHD